MTVLLDTHEVRGTRAAQPPAVRFQNLTKTFGADGPRPYHAIASLNLHVRPGEFLAIVGPSGCGKSSLLRILAGLDQPTTGEVLIDDQPVHGTTPGSIGFLFQQDALLPWRSVRENVALGLLHAKQQGHLSRAAMNELIEAWIVKVGLDGFQERYPAQLSGGMRKRVAIAQTLIGNPDLILMDEPFSALDAQSRHIMEEDLLALCGGRTVLFVTHDLDEATALADRIAVMSAGPRSRIKAVVDVDMPRPRDLLAVRDNPRFAEVTALLWHQLYEEVRRVYGR
jgi:NitT/TauT family transport system ATP-binding protein